MATFLELECKGVEHEKFNLGFLLKVSKFSKKITFIAGHSHIEVIREQIPNDLIKKINFISINIPEKHYKINSILKYYKIFQSLKHKIDFNENVFMLSFFSWDLLAIKFFLASERIKVKSLFFVCHGALENLIILKSISGIKRYLKPKNLHVFFLSMVIKNFNSKRFTYLFLSKHIENNFNKSKRLINTIPHKTIDLPYYFDLIKSKSPSKDFCYGTIGKGDLGMTKSLLEKRKNLKFKIVRSIASKEFIQYKNCIFFDQNTRLSREKIRKEVEEVDFLLFFYPENHYQLSVSGALYDAINYLKPIIFLRNSCISYYNDTYNIGIECESLEEMISIIDSKVELEKNHSIFSKNMEKLKLKLNNDDISLLWD